MSHETRIKAWLSRLPPPLFILVCAGILAAVFAMGLGTWYVARNLGWWTFSLLYMASSLFTPVWKSARKRATP